MMQGDGWLTARDRYLLPLKQNEPDRWSEKVQPLLDQIEDYDLGSSKTPPRLRGKLREVRSEPERMLELIRSDWERGDYASADDKLSALAKLLVDDPEGETMRILVESWQKTLTKLQQKLPDRREYVESAISRAKGLLETEPEKSRQIAQGILTLYQNDEALRDLLDAARHLIESTAPNVESEHK